MANESIYAQLLVKLQQQLQGILKYIELDLGQLEVYELRPAVDFPCGLIRFVGQYQQHQFGSQWNNFQLIIKLGFDTFGNTSNIVPVDLRQKSLEYLDVEQGIYKKLQGWDADGILITPLRRVADADQYSEDGLRKRILTYTGMFCDDSLTK